MKLFRAVISIPQNFSAVVVPGAYQLHLDQPPPEPPQQLLLLIFAAIARQVNSWQQQVVVDSTNV
jgi:hypothetical protein